MAPLKGLIRVVLAVGESITDAIDGNAFVVRFARELVVWTVAGSLFNDLRLIPVVDARGVSIEDTESRICWSGSRL